MARALAQLIVVTGLVLSGTSFAAPPDDTLYDYFPDERPIDDCYSLLPKPNCGSEARGGWHMTVVFVAIVLGLAFIAWRVVRSARRARRLPS